MTDEFKFKGVFPALVTPFDENGVNEEQYRGLIDYVIKSGATGVVPCGTTGEFTSMSFEEKVKAIRIACDATKGRVPVLAGTGAASTNEAIKLSKAAVDAGASAVLVVTPYFLRPTTKELYEHFEKISNSCEIPLFLYNIPQVTGVHLDWWLIDGLREIDGIAGMKDSSGNLIHLTTVLVRRPKDFQVVIGHDEVAFPALASGCDGAILMSANVFPDHYIQMEEAIAKGDLSRGFEIQRSLQRTIRLLVNRGGGMAIKIALNMMGIPVGDARLPLIPGDAMGYQDIDDVRTCLEDLDLIPRGSVTYKVGEQSYITESYPKAVGMVPDVVNDLTLLHGEALCGNGHEVAHVDLILGLKEGPMEQATRYADKPISGYHNCSIIKDLGLTTVYAPTVTITNENHRDLIYGIAQDAVADAIKRSIADNIFPKELIPKIAIAANVFVHPNANNPRRIYINNFRAVRFALRRAIEGRQSVDEIRSRKDSARHPFAYNP
jgi:4-hydroxy-tetrahydrodipicolinate synthase